jgi:hypothetical protein
MYEWDEDNVGHVAIHGIEPVEAQQVIENDPVDLEIQQHSSEDRLVQLGVTNALRVLVVVSTWRSDLIRVVTAFPAPPQLQSFYFQEKVENI